MKVLQICSARSIGGGERHVIDLSNGLAERGHDVCVAVAPGSPVADRLTGLPAENIVEVPLRNALDLQSAVGIARLVKRRGIELINAHLARDYPIAAAAARIAGVPYVITRHVLFPMSRLHRKFLSRTRFVISPSNAVAENLRREGIFPSEKIVTIRYGVDPARFPLRPQPANERFTIGAIGNLDPVKGFDVLIRAAAIVKRQLPDVRFEIVGEDRSPDRRNEVELRELIRDLGLDETVVLEGWSSDVATKLAGFDIFVSSSRSESFGFAVAEAMLCGVPVIASRTEGAAEIISEPMLGELAPIADTESLADAILRLEADAARRDQLSSAGREYISRHFSLKRMVDETEVLYTRVLAD
jgi:glycosyltransferase involved in cell wall biosynthesis